VLLGNFYNFIWPDSASEGWALKRMVRDHLHYGEGSVARRKLPLSPVFSRLSRRLSPRVA
jgi:hypothetical protein